MLISIEDKSYQPTIFELSEFIGNTLFDELCQNMDNEYKALKKIEFSGDKVLLGWNLKFKKSGKTLCTVYPRRGHFPLLLVVGSKEKERVEKLLPNLSDEFQSKYENTAEGMGQRWMIFDISANTPVYEDVLKVIRIRRETK